MPVCSEMKAAVLDGLTATGIPLMCTWNGIDRVPEDHPLFLGVASGMAIDRDILETIHAADLILAIGFDPVECDQL